MLIPLGRPRDGRIGMLRRKSLELACHTVVSDLQLPGPGGTLEERGFFVRVVTAEITDSLAQGGNGRRFALIVGSDVAIVQMLIASAVQMLFDEVTHLADSQVVVACVTGVLEVHQSPFGGVQLLVAGGLEIIEQGIDALVILLQRSGNGLAAGPLGVDKFGKDRKHGYQSQTDVEHNQHPFQHAPKGFVEGLGFFQLDGATEQHQQQDIHDQGEDDAHRQTFSFIVPAQHHQEGGGNEGQGTQNFCYGN